MLIYFFLAFDLLAGAATVQSSFTTCNSCLVSNNKWCATAGTLLANTCYSGVNNNALVVSECATFANTLVSCPTAPTTVTITVPST